MPWRSRESRDDVLRMAVLGTPLTGIGWRWESTGNRDWSSSGRGAGNGGLWGGPWRSSVSLPAFPLHTPLYLLFTGHLRPAQCQAQGYYREKAQAHPQGMSRCQELGRALEWTLNWEWPTDGHS